jgi:SAM-dependent MidA family methyltransferase
MTLEEIIIKKIRAEGPISFKAFMEMALYFPGLGYYTSVQDKIGIKGDYYTSSSLSPVIGVMIGRQLEEMWGLTGKNEFTIVEYGAGTGTLCSDIMEYLKNNKAFYDKLNYSIIEKSPALCEQAKKHLSHLSKKINWHNSILDIHEITGCVLSNELVDNFPVHRVVMLDELMEVHVGYEQGFIELLLPASNELKNYLDELQVILPKDLRTEINTQAIAWLKEIAEALKKGYIITLDYGTSSSELYNKSKRSCGTLRCYNKHMINNRPYMDIGKQDITSHVNFSALCHWGIKNGLECCGLTNQANFLLALGFKHYFRNAIHTNQDLVQLAIRESFLTRTLLMDMGQKIKVLIQRKGIPAHKLSGMNLQY